MARKRKRPPGAANRNGRGVSRHRRENARTIARQSADHDAVAEFELVNAEVDPSVGAREVLLADMWKLFAEARYPESLPTGLPGGDYNPNAPTILPAPIGMEGRPRSEWSRDRPLSPDGLANLLKGFGVGPGTNCVSHNLTATGYRGAIFELIWKRYGISIAELPGRPSDTTSQVVVSKEFCVSASVASPDGVTDGTQSISKVNGGRAVTTDKSPLPRETDFSSLDHPVSLHTPPRRSIDSRRGIRALSNPIGRSSWTG